MNRTIGDVTELLIPAVTASDAELAALVADAGLDAVADALVTEIVFRCPDPINTTPVNVALDITDGTASRRVMLRVVRGEPVAASGAHPIHSRLSMSAANLARRLFGPFTGSRTGDFHNSFLPALPDDLSTLPHLVVSAAQATNTVLSGCSNMPPSLDDLSVRYNSDKWASFHWYTPHYERHFRRFRDTRIRLLEIGIGGYEEDLGGASLKMWKRYFHRGQIFGVDLYDKSALNEPRLKTLVGDQGDPDAMIAIAERYGPFDIIIDDGSHINEHVRTSFDALFGHLRHGGVYVVEDLQTAYSPSFGGTPGNSAAPDTSIGLVKQLADDLHHQDHDTENGEADLFRKQSVTGLHLYHNIVFVDRGINAEAGLPHWMNRESWETAHGSSTS